MFHVGYSQRFRRNSWRIVFSSLVCAIVMLSSLGIPTVGVQPAAAQSIACNEAALIAAISAANAAGSGVIEFPAGCTITLTGTQPGQPFDGPGPTGLPTITGTVTIYGNGGTITRSASASNFRIFFVTGTLSLINITLSNGRAVGGNGGSPYGSDSVGAGNGGGGMGYNGGRANSSKGAGGGGSGGVGADSNDDSVFYDAAGGAGVRNGGATGGGTYPGYGHNGGGGGAPNRYTGVGGNGGAGGFGGGGGGGANGSGDGFVPGGGPGGDGGAGGFGGGGGGGGGGQVWDSASNVGGDGGAGGFGGGDGGDGGNFYLDEASGGGGGGAGLGGAIFIDTGGRVYAAHSTFSSNAAVGGDGGDAGGRNQSNAHEVGGGGGDGGSAYGGAIFDMGTYCVTNVSYSGNTVTAGSGGTGAGGGLNGNPGLAISADLAAVLGGTVPTCATTTTTPAAQSATYSASGQLLNLTATVTTMGTTVNAGVVTFNVYDSSNNLVGLPVSAPVSSGSASAMFSLPGGTLPGTYSIHAVYVPTPGVVYTGSLGTATLTIAGVAPAFTSADNTSFTVDTAGSFTVTTSGSPYITISGSGLPAWLTLTDHGDGTATLAGTPTTIGSVPFTLTAQNGVAPNATQNFTLTVNGIAPAFTSADNTSFTVDTAGSFTVTTSGKPMAAISGSGLPAWLTLTDHGDGTATLAGTPPAIGAVPFTLTAQNGVAPNATQNFTLTVNGIAPAFTSADNTTFTVGTAGSFTVTTSGKPVATISGSGLPAWLTLTDHGDGTATLAGTPPAGSGGNHGLTLTATNGVAPDASQPFTLTVNEAPTFTSADNTSFTVGTAGSFTVTTSGSPTAAISGSGLPAWLTLTDHGDGTATLAGTPPTIGAVPFTLTAQNGVAPNATQNFTLTVNGIAPAFTSADNTSFTVDTAGSFTVTTSGNPTATISGSGLPAWLTLTDHGDSTATLAGTPPTMGVVPFTLTAQNGVVPNATQNFTLTVNGIAPAFTSADNTTFTVGMAGSFTVTTSGNPTATISGSGLPAWLTLTDHGDSTATLAGTPPAGSGGNHGLTLTATNGMAPDATQPFTLTVNEAPAFTSADHTTFTVGMAGSFTVTTSGNPAATISGSGLPAWLTLTDHGDGTATLAGTPPMNSGGNHGLILTATNGVAPDAVQPFTLTVNEAPIFTSADNTTFTVGMAGSFTVTTSSNPAATISGSGLPAWLTLTAHGDGTATLAGTPPTMGVVPFTLTATNGVAPNATQNFTLTVNGVTPAFTSADNTTFAVGMAGSFTVTTSGNPAATISGSGLPAWLTLTDHGDGTATLAGTSTTVGTVPFTLTATNGVAPDATQNFTLTVSGTVVAHDDGADVSMNASITLNVLTNDVHPDGDPLHIAGVGKPAHGQAGVENGEIVYTPDTGYVGTDAFTYTAADVLGASDEANVSIVVWQPLPLCADFDGSTNEIIRADVPGDTVTSGSVFCRVLTENTVYVRMSAEVGRPEVINRGVIQAVDVFALLHNGSSALYFNNPISVCLQGSGAFLYLDATVSPRAVVELPVYVQSGYTCASVPNAGTVVLVGGSASVVNPAPDVTAPTGPATPLSGCMVTTRDILNLREQPSSSGTVIRMIPYDVTLTAFERTAGWFYVDYNGQRGWVSAGYVTPQGSCGQ